MRQRHVRVGTSNDSLEKLFTYGTWDRQKTVHRKANWQYKTQQKIEKHVRAIVRISGTLLSLL